MNKVFLNGYLAADPKQNFTNKGYEQALFNVGVTDINNYTQSYFFPCVAWNNQAKFINSNLKKGSFVAIDGRLTRRSYVDSEGKNIYITEVVVDNVRSFNTKQHNEVNNTNIDHEKSNDTITIIDQVINSDTNQSIAPQTNDNASEDEKAFDWDWDLE